jgi:hypothetical protein
MGGADGVMSLGACKARARRALLALCGDDALGQELIRLWRLAGWWLLSPSIPSYHDTVSDTAGCRSGRMTSCSRSFKAC